jgi:WD40 repeat protein
MTGAILLSVALLGTGAGITTHRYQTVSAAVSAAEPAQTTASLARPDDEKKDKKEDKEKDKSPTADSPDGKMVAVGHDKSVILLDKASGKALRRMDGHGDKVTALAFSPDGKHIVSGSADKTTFLWDMATGKTLWRFTGGDMVQSVKFSEDARTVTVQEAGGKKHTLETGTGKAVNRKSD